MTLKYIHEESGASRELIVPKGPFSDEERADLRRVIMTYQYDVERLAHSYQRLYTSYSQVAADAERIASEHNKMVRWLSSSRLWKLCRALGALFNFLLGRGRYVDLLRPVGPPKRAPVIEPEALRPELPDIPAISYRAQTRAREKNWQNTQFRSQYYYNQLDKILARKPQGERKIFIQSPIIDWFVPLYQRPQHMALAMARNGYLVFYMTANSVGDRATGFHEVEENVFITNQPVHLMTEGALVSFYSTVSTLLAWQGGVIEKTRERGNKILYEYIDHIDAEISFHTTDLLAKQFSLIDDGAVDIGLASARSLQEELRAKLSAAPLVYVPNGVDIDHYQSVLAHDARSTVPPGMRDVVDSGKPIVGYFGAMAPWLWYPMLNELAERRKDLMFVFIGPDYLGGGSKLEKRQNVRAIGAVDYALLPYHAQHFDAAIIPFKPGDIAKTTSPLKLFEYFALGKPVVVTAGMRECEQFDEVLTAGSGDEYSQALDEALLRARNKAFVARCMQLAEQNTWDARAAELCAAHARLSNSTQDTK